MDNDIANFKIKQFLDTTKYECIFDYFNLITKNSSQTDFSGMLSNMKVKGIQGGSIPLFREFFQELEKLGIGELHRNGSRYSFKWTVIKPTDMKNFINGTLKISKSEQKVPEFVAPSLKLEEDKYYDLEHVFLLRKNFNIKLSLPVDFNKQDCERLTSFLNLLVL